MHILIIKGNDAQAWAACAEHGVDDEVADITHREQHDDTLVLLNDAVPVATIAEWFCEPYNPPASAGTLLWYGPAKQPVVPEGWDKVEG